MGGKTVFGLAVYRCFVPIQTRSVGRIKFPHLNDGTLFIWKSKYVMLLTRASALL